MESVGQKLREARSSLSLTLEQVSSDTRITLKNLSAIEADDLSGMGSAFFYRSFVRQFAHRVSLDYSSIAADVEQVAGSMPEPLIPGQGKGPAVRVRGFARKRRFRLGSLRPLVSFCLAVAACSGVYTLWERSHFNPQLVVSSFGNGFQSLKARFGTAAARHSAPPEAAAPEVAIETPAPNSVAMAFHLELSAVEATWLSIVADGKETFSGVLNPSESKVLDGHNFARIRTGNAGGLDVVFNGKEIGVLGPRGQVRTVVFTKNNYQVLKPAPTVALLSLNQSAE